MIVYGDSFAVGEYSAPEQSFCGQLAALLTQRPDARVEVLNAGIVGVGPDQIALRMRRDLPRYDPDLVVLVLFAGNDFGDLIRNKLFRVDAAGELQRARPQLADELVEEFDLGGIKYLALGRLVIKASRSIPRRIADWRNHSSGPGRAGAAPGPDLFELQLAIAEREYSEYWSMPDRVTNLFSDGYDADVALLPGSESAHYKRELMAGVLGLIARTAAGHRVPLIAVVVPSPHDLVEGYDGARIDRQRWADYAPDNLTGALVEASRRNGIAYVDLTGPFAAADPASLYFRGGDNHWNDAGQALAARLVADAIRNAGLLHAVATPAVESDVEQLAP